MKLIWASVGLLHAGEEICFIAVLMVTVFKAVQSRFESRQGQLGLGLV